MSSRSHRTKKFGLYCVTEVPVTSGVLTEFDSATMDWRSILAVGAVLVCLLLVYSTRIATAINDDNSTVEEFGRLMVSVESTSYASRRKRLLAGCGQLCNTSMTGTPSKWFNFVAKKFDCRELWSNVDIDESVPATQWPPRMPPPETMDDFSHGGRVVIKPTGYATQQYSSADALTAQWTHSAIDSLIAEAQSGTMVGSYDGPTTQEVSKALSQVDLKDKTVLVIGSERPWVEVLALLAGTKMVYTQKSKHINCTHPQIRTMTPAYMREQYMKNALPKFDAVISFSSVEHSGLGRYGDALNPWGDIQAVARAWCVVPDGAPMVLGVPMCGPPDRINYNLHRCYDAHLWSQLVPNWEQAWQADPLPWQGPRVLRKVPQPTQ